MEASGNQNQMTEAATLVDACSVGGQEGQCA